MSIDNNLFIIIDKITSIHFFSLNKKYTQTLQQQPNVVTSRLNKRRLRNYAHKIWITMRTTRSKIKYSAFAAHVASELLTEIIDNLHYCC